jgi:SAM-dependent methyltransferase
VNSFPVWAVPGGGRSLAPDEIDRDEHQTLDLVRTQRSREVGAWAESYGRVRRAEGRGSLGPEVYRSLPWTTPDTAGHDHWRVRARSFDLFVKALLNPHVAEVGRELEVLDVGGGNGWAAARLIDLGHRAAVVDVNLDEADGLGARHHHGVEIPAARAEMEALPLLDASCDVVMFGASLHYASDQVAAIAEACRVVRPGGRVVIMDSPTHRFEASGRRMVAEQEARLGRSLGIEIPVTPGVGFVLRDAPQVQWSALGLEWETITVTRGFTHRMDRLRGWVRCRREPAAFMLMTGRKGS